MNKPLPKNEAWIEYLEGELPFEEYELRGSLLRRSITERETVTRIESVRDAVKEADPNTKFKQYLDDSGVHQRIHESVMNSIMQQPLKSTEKKRGLLKIYSGLQMTLGLRRPPGRS